MMKTEFEDLIHGVVTVEEFELIESLYMWDPAFRNTSGKEDVGVLYKSFGIIIFKDMYPRAMKLKEIDEEIRSLNRAKDSLIAKRERLKRA